MDVNGYQPSFVGWNFCRAAVTLKLIRTATPDVVSGGRCVLSIVRNGPCQLQCCSHPEQTDYLSFASVSRRVQTMISADYDVSTRWIIAPDDVTGTPVSTVNSSAVSVFERYTWTQFLQVRASVVGDVVSPPARAARNAAEGGPMFCLCFLFVFFVLTISARPIVSTSTEPIFTEFSGFVELWL